MVQHILPRLLEQTDLAARDNVLAGRGGPFAASLHVHDSADNSMTAIAGPVGNAVLETGLASAHAEDRVLMPDNITALKKTLRELGPDRAAVYLVSSAESCPACHAKLEILARVLVHEKLLLPYRFHVVYGAGYDDTRDVAGFHDAPYHHDMTQPEGQRLISVLRGKRHDLPPGYAAVILQDGQVFAAADKGEDDIIATAEIGAIRAACAAAKAAGSETPWNLQGALLYAPVAFVGPLMYAEAQWANIGRIVISGAAGRCEAPGIGNDELFRAVALRPYNNRISALRVMQLSPFENLAQREWARLKEENPERVKTYNGCAAERQ